MDKKQLTDQQKITLLLAQRSLLAAERNYLAVCQRYWQAKAAITGAAGAPIDDDTLELVLDEQGKT